MKPSTFESNLAEVLRVHPCVWLQQPYMPCMPCSGAIHAVHALQWWGTATMYSTHRGGVYYSFIEKFSSAKGCWLIGPATRPTQFFSTREPLSDKPSQPTKETAVAALYGTTSTQGVHGKHTSASPHPHIRPGQGGRAGIQRL